MSTKSKPPKRNPEGRVARLIRKVNDKSLLESLAVATYQKPVIVPHWKMGRPKGSRNFPTAQPGERICDLCHSGVKGRIETPYIDYITDRKAVIMLCGGCIARIFRGLSGATA